MVRSWIEFHDSELRAIINSGSDMLVQLSAYVHRWEHRDGSWVGTGWMQPVRIVLKNARSQFQTLSTPTELTDGCIRVDETVYDNWVPLPFVATTPVAL